MAIRFPGPAMAAGLAAPALAVTLVGVPLTVATACAGIAYLVARSTGPDLTDRHIPRDACWHAALVGVVAASASLFLGPSLSAGQLIGTLPILLLVLAGLTVPWWLGRGGFGDVRLVAAMILLTGWWITPVAALMGFAGMFVTAGITAIALRRATIPAGPALSAIFVVAAFVSLAVPTL